MVMIYIKMYFNPLYMCSQIGLSQAETGKHQPCHDDGGDDGDDGNDIDDSGDDGVDGGGDDDDGDDGKDDGDGGIPDICPQHQQQRQCKKN